MIVYSEKLAVGNPEVAKITLVLKNIHEGLETCTKKIVSASKFIDYFVHDMLDYTILNKEEKNFTKTIDKFDIRTAINEIIEIQEDKISMKTLQVDQHFVGFEGNSFIVHSDQKRI